ncbi:MAG: energy-coupling factor ABC transporter permease [Heliobacteriaceae bacterium]|nr:energy-coupling factor ABC transporter permease [Heliobacteriaceae bacterium]MDD4588543.1 energy-coupling factor ABC transporter permease [Heliobacteriaceae bacterium]
MHIPDGFLDAKTWVAASLISAATVSYAAKKTREVLSDRQIPRLAVMAAFIFAAQMVNFPVAGGTSGHLIGAALAAITFGPWSAVLIMSTVLIIQCLFFQDGGLTALGANILLMGITAPFIAHWVYHLFVSPGAGRSRMFAGTFAAAWCSTFVASMVCALLLAVSGTVIATVGFPAMAFWHAIIGIGEGVITALVLAYLTQVRGELVFENAKV